MEERPATNALAGALNKLKSGSATPIRINTIHGSSGLARASGCVDLVDAQIFHRRHTVSPGLRIQQRHQVPVDGGIVGDRWTRWWRSGGVQEFFLARSAELAELAHGRRDAACPDGSRGNSAASIGQVGGVRVRFVPTRLTEAVQQVGDRFLVQSLRVACSCGSSS